AERAKAPSEGIAMVSTAASAVSHGSPTRERPLSPPARAALVVAAAATILLFYVAAVVSMAILGVIVVLLLLVIIGGARFGLAGFLTPLIAPPSALFVIIARRLWLPEETAWRIALERHEAPRLFEGSRALATKLGVAPPSAVVVE